MRRVADATVPLLDVRDLVIDFSIEGGVVHAVRGISFSIEPGRILGLVGESGSGKSATGKAIMRLLGDTTAVVSGEVRFAGEELLAAAADRMRRLRGAEIATIFQDPLSSLHPSYRVGAQIAEAYRVHHRVSRAAAARRAVELLDLVGIAEPRRRAQEYPHRFSGGMRQRVMIAMALSCRPRLLIADEPTTALDVTVQAEILDLIGDLSTQLGSAVLFITHDLGVVAELCDDVVVLHDGEVQETGGVYQLFESPQSSYTRSLLAATPRIDRDIGTTLRTVREDRAHPERKR